ncbi:MAG: ATP synthase F1 subunit gamma [Bacteroidales bacterium]|nr:ATP synthase F1 subunit gamma [Bacteroidales bacterium]
MANLKEIRTRLASVKTTRQITSAMKMVSAAKLRKSQDAIIQMRPYANALQQIFKNLSQNVESPGIDLYKNTREVHRALFVVITSNKGLCGAFNSNITKKLIADINEEFALLNSAGNAEIFCIGKKGAELLQSKGFKINHSKHEIFDNLTYKSARDIAIGLIDKYLKGEYDLIRLYYNNFKNAGTQVVTCEQYLPFPIEPVKNYEQEYLDYILEPSKEEIITDLIPKSLKIQFYKALLESNASEHGARMTAMHKATDNATELIKTLQLDYNKARQASITNEILEIVGGAEALKG